MLIPTMASPRPRETLAITSGLGGGMIRDVLLQVGPPLALTDSAYLLVAIAGRPQGV